MPVPVYLMPGMAAGSQIFEFIKLPEEFELYYLEWKIPAKAETLEEYVLRILPEIVHDNPVLIGVSFGGVIVQELSKHLSCRKVIIISSVKSNKELPYRMRISKTMRLYHLAPVKLARAIKHISGSTLPGKLGQRLDLYKKYLSVDDAYYLRWAIKQIISWRQDEALEGVVHIHGDADPVFPARYIKDFIKIDGGTHIMIITRFKWFNKNLPLIINN